MKKFYYIFKYKYNKFNILLDSKNKIFLKFYTSTKSGQKCLKLLLIIYKKKSSIFFQNFKFLAILLPELWLNN